MSRGRLEGLIQWMFVAVLVVVVMVMLIMIMRMIMRMRMSMRMSMMINKNKIYSNPTIISGPVVGSRIKTCSGTFMHACMRDGREKLMQS